MAKMKVMITEKDKTIAKHRTVYRDIKTLRDKHRQTEKERL